MSKSAHARFRIVGLGEVLWDMLPSGRVLGGAPANGAYHAHALGAEGIVASCVGNDEDGAALQARVGALDLSTAFVSVDGQHPTGTVSVTVDAAGIPSYVIHEGVAWDVIPATTALMQLAAEADAVSFGSLAQRSPVSRETIRAFLCRMRPDSLRVFDINLRQHFYSREVVETSLALATVLKINDEELPVVAGMLGLAGDADRVATALIERCALRLVALTRGGAGSTLYAAGCKVSHPGFRTEVVDTVGAGDAFTAVLTLGLLRGMELERMAEHANRVAAYVCSRPGATPALPSALQLP